MPFQVALLLSRSLGWQLFYSNKMSNLIDHAANRWCISTIHGRMEPPQAEGGNGAFLICWPPNRTPHQRDAKEPVFLITHGCSLPLVAGRRLRDAAARGAAAWSLMVAA